LDEERKKRYCPKKERRLKKIRNERKEGFIRSRRKGKKRSFGKRTC